MASAPEFDQRLRRRRRPSSASPSTTTSPPCVEAVERLHPLGWSAAVVAVDFQGVGLVVEVVAAQIVDGSAAAGDAYPASGVVALFVDAGGSVGVVVDGAAAVTYGGRQVLQAAVGGPAYPGLPAEVDLWVDADAAGRAVDPCPRRRPSGASSSSKRLTPPASDACPWRPGSCDELLAVRAGRPEPPQLGVGSGRKSRAPYCSLDHSGAVRSSLPHRHQSKPHRGSGV